MTFDWDWPAAEVEFRRAVELNSGSCTVHLYYGLCLTMAGRTADAVAELQQAKELDPTSPYLVAYVSFAFYLAHEYDRAIPPLLDLNATNPEFYLAYPFLGLCYEQTGDLKKAVAAFEQTVKLDPNLEGRAQLGHAYAVSGQWDKAQDVLHDLLELSKQHYVSPYNIAVLYLGLGDKDQAIFWLEKAAKDHSEPFTYLNIDPRLEPLRNDPRFAERFADLRNQIKLGPAGR
jgi:tetratricopeptide (TPR) repeat protein